MRVLQITNYVFPGISGIGTTAMDIAYALKELNVEQKVLCFNSDVEKNDLENRHRRNIRSRVNGIEVLRCKMNLHISSQQISFHFGKILERLISEFKPEIVVLHYPNPFLAHYILKYRNKKIKFILWWHSDIVNQKLLRKLFVLQNYRLLDWAWKVVATSPDYINGSKYLSKYRSKTVVHPSCIREDELKVSDEIKNRGKEIKTAGKIMCFALGRHVKYKGFEYLIKASRLLDEKFEIYIGGSGPLTGRLKKLAEEDKKIHFTGYLNDTDREAYYYACDIFCFPSITKNEAFGLALAEGMFYGKPAVTFHIEGSGVNYVNLNNVTGLECENRNVSQYAEALNKLAENEQWRKKLGANARERVKQNFTYKIFQENIAQLFEINSVSRGL